MGKITNVTAAWLAIINRLDVYTHEIKKKKKREG